jgi:SAM-dependent methyltransferase
MNEELKPDEVSSGAVQRNDRQGDHPWFATDAELKDFLIRRQLLEMESKRIKEVLDEAEAELKNRQDRLIGVRDGTFASLRNHLERRQEQAREQQARAGGLQNLPKAAERYIRRRVKQLFGSRKKPAAGEAADGTGWHLPRVRELYAWTRWFAENDPALRKPLRYRKDRIQVALVVSGGTGDLLESTHLVGPVSDHFSCDVFIIAAQSNVAEIVARNPYVFDALVPVTEHVFGLVDRLRNIPVFDLIITWRYNVQYVIPRGSRIPTKDIQSIESGSGLRAMLDRYCITAGWPYFNFAFSRETARLGLSALDVSVETSGLPHRNLNEIPFFPSKQSLRVLARLLAKPYVTVHHGFDSKLLPARTRNTEYSSTKNLSLPHWGQIVSLLRKEGTEVIQLGIAEEEKIEGVTHCLNGQTSLEETALLIKHGLCHIDTEGGLVHLANAVHARCVVLFGPTPAEFFGYPQNINLAPSGCKACWFATKNWLIECARHTSGPECMKEHSASRVADAVNKLIAESEQTSAKLLAAETRHSPTPVSETVVMAQNLLGHDAANRALLILDELPGDIGTAWSDSALGGSDVILCDGNPANLKPHDRAARRLEYGCLLNLPRASSSIEAAVWVARELESDIAPFALREIFRVLKPGGQLVFAVAGESAGLDLRQSLSAARIGFKDDEIPPVPVYACSLRKTGPQAAGVPSRSRSAASVEGLETTQCRNHAVDPRLALIEEENARQINLVGDRAAERQKVIDEEHIVIEGAVQRGFGGDGWIWVSESFADGYPSKFFLTGWGSPLEWVIWSRESKCVLMLPYPEEPSRCPRIELQLHLAVPRASASSPMTIGICVDDGPIENFRLSTDDTILTVQVPTESARFRGVSLVEFHLDDAIFYGESDRTLESRVMGVKRFRYRSLNS